MNQTKSFLIILLIVIQCSPGSVQAQISEANILSLGAKGNANFSNTGIIQQAIDKMHAAGGGKVILPAGKYLTGSISLRSGVTLELLYGAILLGSTDPFDYLDQENNLQQLINAEEANQIAIIGAGSIDGRGKQLALKIDSLYHAGIWNDPGYNFKRHRPGRRPKLMEFRKCNDIKLQGITVKNSASWVLNFDLCSNLRIDRVTVDSDDYWNNDGMDIGDCKNVRITNCYVNSADDGICLKSHHQDHLNDSIYIANCTVRSSGSAIKFGTASHGGFRNVKIENIRIFDTFRSAIALESVDGGILEDVEISGITAINTGNAIFIRLGHRNQDGPVGTLRNIRIRDVMVQVPFSAPDQEYTIRGPELPFFHNPFPASITGIPGHKVEDVQLENIRIFYPGHADPGYAQIPVNRLDDVPENEAAYPEFHMFGELPAWAFYVRHVDGLSFENIEVKVKNQDFRPAFVFNDVDDLNLDQINFSPSNTEKQVILKDVHNHSIDRISIDGELSDQVLLKL